MAKGMKKGYFVRGEFVAEGSARDLELKAELKGSDAPSRTDLKRESEELQALGQALLTLRPDALERLALSDKLLDALTEAKRITNFEGKRRQMQFIGKLMRKLDPAEVDAVRAALDEQASGSASEKLALHQAEQWRDRLLQDDDALAPWLAQCPATDIQQLRTLIRQARKDALPEKPGAAPRHGRAYREIFQLVRDGLAASPYNDSPTDVFSVTREAS